MALNLDARNARAYLGKLLAGLRVPTIEGLEYQAKPFDFHPQYKKIMRFGDEQLISKIQGYNQSIRDRIQRTSDAEAEAADIAGKYRESALAYCIAARDIASEEDRLKKIEKAIGDKNNEINYFKNELNHLGTVFTGKRRKELIGYILQREQELNKLEEKAVHSQSVIDNAQRQTEKPDHKMMVYQMANVYFQKGLYDRAAKEFIKIRGFGDVSELTGKNGELKAIMDTLIPDEEKYIQKEEEEAKFIYESALEEAKNAVRENNGNSMA